MRVVGEEFMDRVLYYKKAWLPARQLVVDAIEKRMEVNIILRRCITVKSEFTAMFYFCEKCD